MNDQARRRAEADPQDIEAKQRDLAARARTGDVNAMADLMRYGDMSYRETVREKKPLAYTGWMAVGPTTISFDLSDGFGIYTATHIHLAEPGKHIMKSLKNVIEEDSISIPSMLVENKKVLISGIASKGHSSSIKTYVFESGRVKELIGEVTGFSGTERVLSLVNRELSYDEGLVENGQKIFEEGPRNYVVIDNVVYQQRKESQIDNADNYHFLSENGEKVGSSKVGAINIPQSRKNSVTSYENLGLGINCDGSNRHEVSLDTLEMMYEHLKRPSLMKKERMYITSIEQFLEILNA